MRPIDADALMKAMYHIAFETDGDTMWQSGCWVRYRAIEQVVKEQPTVDVQPVRHGWWIEDKEVEFVCSECGEQCANTVMGMPRDRYCKWCGARMDFEKGDKEK